MDFSGRIALVTGASKGIASTSPEGPGTKAAAESLSHRLGSPRSAAICSATSRTSGFGWKIASRGWGSSRWSAGAAGAVRSVGAVMAVVVMLMSAAEKKYGIRE